VAGEAKLAMVPLPKPERGPERLLGIDLLQGLEQAPPQRRERTLLWALGQGPGRWLLRHPGRVLLRVREQPPAQTLVRRHGRRPGRGPGMRPGQGPVQQQGRLLLPALPQRPERVPERGLF
jgi:hypothetical protein